jgi:hypothetical protein
MISQLDEASLPYVEIVLENQNERFPWHWIGRSGSKPWPP